MKMSITLGYYNVDYWTGRRFEMDDYLLLACETLSFSFCIIKQMADKGKNQSNNDEKNEYYSYFVLAHSYRRSYPRRPYIINWYCDNIGKAPQSVFSKEQTALLQAINESPLTVEEKNSLLRYLYFSAVYLKFDNLSLIGAVYALFGERHF